MGWIECVHCEKLQRDFVARTFALIAPVVKQSQINPNTMQRTKTCVLGSMGWIECVRCEKLQRDFMAQTFALALVHPVLHRVSCSYETIPNPPKHYDTHQNMN